MELMWSLMNLLLSPIWYADSLVLYPPFPPGPQRDFLTGNTLNIPVKKPWLKYSDWAEKYGLRIAGQGNVVIINSVDAARDLLERRGQIYSDRTFSMMDDLCVTATSSSDIYLIYAPRGGGMPYNNSLRKHRRLYQQNFGPTVVHKFQPVQKRKIHDLVLNLVHTPEDFYKHVSTATGAIIMSTMYGHDIEQTNDPFIEVAEKASSMRGILLAPGKFPVSQLPFARYFPSWAPGCGFKQIAHLSREYTEEAQTRPFNFAMKQKMSGKATSLVADLVEQLLEDDPDYTEKLNVIRNMASTGYVAGAATTKSIILTFILAMTLNPNIQAKAQEEIDRVIGAERLPEFSDRENLPYVEAVYRETMRWYPPVPLGTPRRAMQTDCYNGYCIPQGTTIYPNIWAMSRDETQYEEPHQFRPERFLSSENSGINDILLFGFGRRICSGRYLADASVWMAIVSILATLRLEKAKDLEGNDIHVEGDYTDELICFPRQFRCSITPRGPDIFSSLRRLREHEYQCYCIECPAKSIC
ncbi:cytochrome P450 [Gymnopus androsaceus JB14]|uniref:Cytochrome P450 n=1 Tax=Gymnopus androsaceus JB14 TaxID=1447944 RepID=A0A6A4HG18_9AGAR|nr:cytochrome P450 [Gymnopus androsaceus JB14]